jgi:hypothetical protein
MKTQKQTITITLEWADAVESKQLFHSPESAMGRTWEKDGWRLPTTFELQQAFKDSVPGFEPDNYLSDGKGGRENGYAVDGDVVVDMRSGDHFCRDHHLSWGPAQVRFVRLAPDEKGSEAVP